VLVALVAVAAACGNGLVPGPGPSGPARPAGSSTLAGGAVAVPPPEGPTVSPPAALAANCSRDVSAVFQTWLNSLPSGQTVVMPGGSCYRLDQGLRLVEPKGLTLYGGTFRNGSTAPGTPATGKGRPVVTVVGGANVTLEAMHISGMNQGGYHARLAFAGGIELEGTDHATIRGVTISQTFGDGITLAPLRGGANRNSGHIVAPTSAVTIRDVTIERVGRQGVTFASVEGADVSDVVVHDPGLDTFDFEADQGDEGARHVTIDGCRAIGGSLFFANGGAGGSAATGDITVEHCSMAKAEGGAALLVQSRRDAAVSRGPFQFVSDDLWCGTSDYVACVQLSGAQATLTDVTFRFPAGTVHEAVYHLDADSRAVFSSVSASGFGHPGTAAEGSTVEISGGRWTPA